MFTTACFIKKISSELKEKLNELGYRDSGKVRYYGESQYIYCEDGIFYESPCTIKTRYNTFIDCGTNEELFIALAALRDDKPDYQWFLWEHNDGEYHPEENDSWRQYIPGEHWEEWWWFEIRKATVEDIIKHFKKD